ncbi:MAG: tRNA lysidine(34) synthetase TilS [Patescibacteria group bacterium]
MIHPVNQPSGKSVIHIIMNKYPQKSIEGKVLRDIRTNFLIEEGDDIIVAVSGGADSLSLLYILNELKDTLQFTISACHFNHRLRGEASDEDEALTKKNCAKLGIALEVGRASAKNLYKSEDKAREARYRFFEKLVGERTNTKVALAHNLNDLAETFLFNAVRGSGLKGLSSIPASRKNIIRPLLSAGRAEIEDYLQKKGITYSIDRTNSDLKYSRNWIRHKLIPMLKNINPNVVETLGNSAKIFGDDFDFIKNSAIASLSDTMVLETKNLIVLDNKKWLRLPPALQRMVLRLALSKIDSLLDITFKQLEEVENMLKKGHGGKYKLLPHSLRIELANDKITIFKSKKESN